jgi:tetratricopeptide (TPR) repeat protein
MRFSLLLAALPLLLLAAAPKPLPASGLAPRASTSGASLPSSPEEAARDARLAEVRSLLAASKPTEALEKARVALEHDSEVPAVLLACVDAHLALGQKDPALHLLLRAEALSLAAEPDKALLADLDKRLTELDPHRAQVAEAFASLADDTFRMAQSAHKRGLWANAVDLYLRCRGTAFEERAQKQLDAIFGSAKPAEALVASGLPIPVNDDARKSEKSIAKYDKDHALWEKAEKAKDFHSKQYAVTTNMGWRMGKQINLTMEQLNRFLRRFFRHKEQGQPMRACGVRVFAQFDEFASVEGVESPNIGGFFMPGENRISTYDQTTAGRRFDELWGTLFHEGTHQFSKDVTKTLLPGWVEEGAACYMEGARLMPNGVVVSNLVAEDRLEALVSMLGPRPKEGQTSVRPKPGDARIDIKEVITYYQPGSYSGAFYPWGWGLVYFMRNYEDETGDRPYLPAFEAYVEVYKSERKHDVFERFVQYFITDLKRPGIDTFEDWYALWVQWIWALDELTFGGRDVADKLLARAEKQVQNGKAEFAIESFGWALRKRPGDPRGLIGMARAKVANKDDDGAAYFFRQALAWADAQVDQAAKVPGLNEDVAAFRAEAYDGIRSIHANMVEGSERTRTAFRDGFLALAELYSSAGLHESAAFRLTQARTVAGPMSALTAFEARLASEKGVDLRMPRRLAAPTDLSGWIQQGPRLFQGKGETLETKKGDGLSYLLLERPVPGEFEFSARIEPLKETDFFATGLVYADRLEGRKMYGLLPGGRLVSVRIKDAQPEIDEELGMVEELGKSVLLGLRSRAGKLEFLADGEVIAERERAPVELEGRVGLFCQSLQARFSELRARF